MAFCIYSGYLFMFGTCSINIFIVKKYMNKNIKGDVFHSMCAIEIFLQLQLLHSPNMLRSGLTLISPSNQLLHAAANSLSAWLCIFFFAPEDP